MGIKKLRSIISGSAVVAVALALQVGVSSTANAAPCVAAAYPPVVCLNTSSGISPNSVTTVISEAVVKDSAAILPKIDSSPAAGQTTSATFTTVAYVLTANGTPLLDANGQKQTANVVQTLTYTNVNGDIQISRSLTIDGSAVTFSANTTLSAGVSVNAVGSGFAPGTYVDVYIFSKAIYLGSFRVDTKGQFLDSVVIPPSLAAGDHTLTLVGKTAKGKKLIIPSTVKLVKSTANLSKTLSGSIFFDLNRAVITSNSKTKLKALIKQIPAKAKSIVVTIKGYVQPTKVGAEWDLPLSTVRAQVTKNYLYALGLKNATFNVKGLGKYPITTIAGRRADITITWK